MNLKGPSPPTLARALGENSNSLALCSRHLLAPRITLCQHTGSVFQVPMLFLYHILELATTVLAGKMAGKEDLNP